MNSAKYLLRFDDICPRMNWDIWNRIEPLLLQYNIKPILGVVPDNRDPKLNVGREQQDFWQKVNHWQKSGWCIAMHGYQHIYETTDSGLMQLNPYSEFSGLSKEEQKNKLDKAFAIFKSHNIHPDAWIAPAHSFDEITVSLLIDIGINIISDGFYFRPVKRLGAIWIPQQVWHFRDMPPGVWTVCLHFNSYGDNAIVRLENWLTTYADRITSVHDILASGSIKPIGTFDHAFSLMLPLVRRFKQRRWVAEQ